MQGVLILTVLPITTKLVLASVFAEESSSNVKLHTSNKN
jgi:hypothetical protein